MREEPTQRAIYRRVLGKDAEILYTQGRDATVTLLNALLITGP